MASINLIEVPQYNGRNDVNFRQHKQPHSSLNATNSQGERICKLCV